MPTENEAVAADTTPTDQVASDAVVTTEPAVESTAPQTSEEKDAEAIAAFDKGLEEEGLAPKPLDAADVAADAVAAVAAVAPVAATPEPKPGPTTDDLAEAKKYNLKGKAAERFHEMAGAIREFAPVRDVLTKYQITDPKQIETAFADAARGIEWENAIHESTATPEQFGSALNVIRAMNSDDPKLVNLAYESMMETMRQVGARIGRSDLPGDADPLASHPDLLEEVNEGDITRKRALEIVAQRAALTIREQHDAKVNTTTQQQTQYETALAAVDNLSNQLKASDPQFAQKLAILSPTLAIIKANVPPAQWAQTIHQAYTQIVVAPLVAARPSVGPMPRRPAGMSANGANLQRKPATDLEAFEMGVASLNN